MAKRMLIDSTHPEETRVVVLSGNRLEEFDFETSTKKQIKGNIYLAKITRVEPSLQAAFVDYGGNRHGFLAFSEIHSDYYRIPVSDREHDRGRPHLRPVEVPAGADETADAPGEPADELELPELPASHGRAPDPGLEEDAPAEEDASGREEGADHAPAEEEASAREEEAEHAPAVESRMATPTLRDEAPAGDEGEAARDWLGPAESALPAVEETAGAAVEIEAEPGSAPAAVAETLEARGPAGTIPERTGGDSIEVIGGDEMEEASRQRARRHRPYKIQEVIKRRQIMLVQVTKEERGNKGAALTTYLSLAGRYCVLMPNTDRGGGVSRKITNVADRKRLKELVDDLQVPDGMGVIVRTAGSERSKAEIKRDFEYLIRLWDEIRELTLKSTAPALIYEEGNLIKRSIRDLYARDIEEVIVEGEEGYRAARAFMKMLMPSHAKRVHHYRDATIPLFHRFQVEGQIDAIHSPIVQLRSGGYIVINPTEALVSIDVNSGRATRERNIEETALKTNVEAAEEIARQLRLRDLAGLIVIDFIDMEEHRNQVAVERRLKEAMKHDRARIQVGRISPFGLLEMSRQRLRPSLVEASTQPCPHCGGTGHIRSVESTALHVLRAIEEEGMRRRSAEILVAVPPNVALYILNQKRATLAQTEQRYHFRVTVTSDDSLVPPNLRLERLRALTPSELAALPPAITQAPAFADEDEDGEEEGEEPTLVEETAEAEEAPPIEPRREHAERRGHAERREHAERRDRPERAEAGEEGHGRRRRRRRRRRRGGEEPGEAPSLPAAPEPRAFGEAHEVSAQEVAAGEAAAPGAFPGETARGEPPHGEGGDGMARKRRRRGRRGGRRRRHGGHGEMPVHGAPGEDPAGATFRDETESAAAPSERPPAPGGERTSWSERDETRDLPSAPAADRSSRGDLASSEGSPAAAEPREHQAGPPEAPPPSEPQSGGSANAAEPVSVNERPANPRRGWWHRLTQS